MVGHSNKFAGSPIREECGTMTILLPNDKWIKQTTDIRRSQRISTNEYLILAYTLNMASSSTFWTHDISRTSTAKTSDFDKYPLALQDGFNIKPRPRTGIAENCSLGLTLPASRTATDVFFAQTQTNWLLNYLLRNFLIIAEQIFKAKLVFLHIAVWEFSIYTWKGLFPRVAGHWPIVGTQENRFGNSPPK